MAQSKLSQVIDTFSRNPHWLDFIESGGFRGWDQYSLGDSRGVVVKILQENFWIGIVKRFWEYCTLSVVSFIRIIALTKEWLNQWRLLVLASRYVRLFRKGFFHRWLTRVQYSGLTGIWLRLRHFHIKLAKNRIIVVAISDMMTLILLLLCQELLDYYWIRTN